MKEDCQGAQEDPQFLPLYTGPADPPQKSRENRRMCGCPPRPLYFYCLPLWKLLGASGTPWKRAVGTGAGRSVWAKQGHDKGGFGTLWGQTGEEGRGHVSCLGYPMSVFGTNI